MAVNTLSADLGEALGRNAAEQAAQNRFVDPDQEALGAAAHADASNRLAAALARNAKEQGRTVQPEISEREQHQRGALGNMALTGSIRTFMAMQSGISKVVGGVARTFNALPRGARKPAAIALTAIGAIAYVKFGMHGAGNEQHFNTAADAFGNSGTGGSGSQHVEYIRTVANETPYTPSGSAAAHHVQAAGDHIRTTAAVTTDPGSTTVQTPKGTVKVFSSEHMKGVKIDYASSQPGVTPDANHDLHVVTDNKGGVTVRLQDMETGGTTINGKNISAGQIKDLHAAIHLNINGHDTTIYAPMDGKHIKIPADVANQIGQEDLAKLLANHDYNMIQIVVPKNAHHWTSVSTAFGNGHEFTVSQDQLHKLANGYDTYLQNHGGGTAAVSGQELHAANGADIHTVINGNHVQLIDGNKQMKVYMPDNFLTHQGKDFFDVGMPKGVTFADGHWIVAHDQLKQFEDQLNSALAKHGLHANIRTTLGPDGNYYVDQMNFDSLSTGDPSDLMLPPGYNMSVSPDHNSLLIHVPAHGSNPGGDVWINVKDAYDPKTGNYDFSKLQPEIKDALLKQQHLVVEFNGQHAADIHEAAAASSSASASASPQTTPAANSRKEGVTGGEGFNGWWVGGPLLAVGVATAGILGYRAWRRHRNAAPDDPDHTPVPPVPEGVTPEDHDAAVNEGRGAVLNPESESANEFLTSLRDPHLAEEFELGSGIYVRSHEAAMEYAVALAEAGGPTSAEDLNHHFHTIGIDMGNAEFAGDPPALVDTDDGASTRRVAEQLQARYRDMPLREHFAGNDDTQEDLGHLEENYDAHEAAADDAARVGPFTAMQHDIERILERIHEHARPGHQIAATDAIGLHDLVSHDNDPVNPRYEVADEHVPEVARRLAAYRVAAPAAPAGA